MINFSIKKFFFLLFLYPFYTSAAAPDQNWFTLTSKHFYVHYYQNPNQNMETIAKKVTRICEHVHSILVPIFKHTPDRPTHVVLTDMSENANGSAQGLPRNIMRLNISAPTSRSTLNDYDDWLMGLIIHEYTHILHIDTIHGIAKVANAIFGRKWAPNQIQPRWFIEGLATYYESALTTGGRIRNNIFDMFLRMATLNETFLNIDQISSNSRLYPRGTIAYLYGSKLINYIAKKYGQKVLTKISHDYGGTFIPYGINHIVKKYTGKNYLTLYKEFFKNLKEKYKEQKKNVMQNQLTSFKEITTHGESTASPRISMDNREFLYISSDGRSHRQIRIFDIKSSKKVYTLNVSGTRSASFTPDGRSIVFDQTHAWKTFYRYGDLFIHSRDSKKTKRLTHGKRAHEPDVSPDGSTILFVTQNLNHMNIEKIPIIGGDSQIVLTGKPDEQFYSPRFSPDGKSIVYSKWSNNGHRDIYLLHLNTHQEIQITHDHAIDMSESLGFF